MSDEKKPEGGDQKPADKEPTKPSPEPKTGGGSDKAPDEVAELQAKVKAFEKRAASAEKKLEQIESEKLKKDGNLEGLLKREQEKNVKLSEQLKSVTTQTLRQKLETKILKLAPDVHNVDTLIKVSEMKDTVQLDHNTLEIEHLEDGIAKARKAHPYLFKVQHRSVGPTHLPNPSRANLGDDAEAKEFQAKMLKATPAERVTIRKEYGREL